MMENKTLDDLATQLSKLMPAQLSAAGEDLSQNMRAILQGWFDRLDLVTREEFEIQKAVLERTRAKLEALQEQLESLEQESE